MKPEIRINDALRRLIGIVAWGLFFVICAPMAVCGGQFTVVRVYDGDSFRAVGHDITINVRLAGIDSPETGKGKKSASQPFSQQAKTYLTDRVLNKTVEIRGYGLGPYNRILAVVYLEGENINLEMVRSGLAEVYQGQSPRGFDVQPYILAQLEARRAQVGMWILKEKYISPKQWRRIAKR
jgi:micrococcal nuclease